MKPFFRHFLPLALVAFSASTLQAFDATAWLYEQPFSINATGLTRLELPPETLNVALQSQEDIRLISPSGVETPFLIERETLLPPSSSAVVNFESTFANGITQLEFTSPSATSSNEVTLESPSQAFLKPIRLEATLDGSNWTELAKDTVLFRQASGAERMNVSFAAGNWKQWRVFVDDQRSEPIPFTGARVGHLPQPQVSVAQPVTFTKLDDSKWRVDLGARQLRVASLRLECATPVFARRVNVAYELEEQGTKRLIQVKEARIYRVPDEGALKMESLDVPLHQVIPASSLLLTIENGNSPPLELSGISATRYPVSLVFFPREVGPWKLIAGNRDAMQPAYDLPSLHIPLRQGKATKAELGALVANPSFKQPVPLPAVEAKGALIDLAGWKYRKPLSPQHTGIIRFELDTTVLANAGYSFSDLRLIQNEKQIPFLLETVKEPRFIRPQVSIEADAKRPTVSIWKIVMPLSDLPLTALTADSKSPLFDREFFLNAKLDPKNPSRTSLVASGRWVKTSPAGGNRLSLQFLASRLPDTFTLETDNRDNPAIELEDVAVSYRSSALVAKVVETSPMYLYYGNPQAAAPLYDLQLLRQELLASAKVDATLGDQEILKPSAKQPSSTSGAGVGSPLLWIVLALVVIVLLVIIAKMLPPVEKGE